MPLDDILDEIRDAAIEQNVFNTTQRKDLNNIRRDFGIFTGQFDACDKLSVAKLIAHLETKSPNPIRLFRDPQTQNEAEDRAKSFMLVVATQFQLKILHKFGQNGTICMDSTHGTAGYAYHLTTIVVIDDFGNGIPTAFCISSGSSSVEWETFLSTIKTAISNMEGFETTIQAKVVMTDNDESFYNAWAKVMGPVPYRLLCSWHIDQAWRRNLKKVIELNPNHN